MGALNVTGWPREERITFLKNYGDFMERPCLQLYSTSFAFHRISSLESVLKISGYCPCFNKDKRVDRYVYLYSEIYYSLSSLSAFLLRGNRSTKFYYLKPKPMYPWWIIDYISLLSARFLADFLVFASADSMNVGSVRSSHLSTTLQTCAAFEFSK
jgi:hypothetical protein